MELGECNSSMATVRDVFEKLGLCAEYKRARVVTSDAEAIKLVDGLIVKLNTRLSGIEKTLKKGEAFCYIKKFTVNEDFLRDKTLLHFGAVDQVALVDLNGELLGTHIGGYLPFSFDVTEHIHVGENTLTVKVWDNLDTEIPYGKQRKKRGGMWYTPVSGIW